MILRDEPPSQAAFITSHGQLQMLKMQMLKSLRRLHRKDSMKQLGISSVGPRAWPDTLSNARERRYVLLLHWIHNLRIACFHSFEVQYK